MGPPEPPDQDRHQRNDHVAWSPLPGPPHGRDHAGNSPTTHLRGTLMSICSFPAPSQPTGTLALDQLPGRPDGERGAAAVRVRRGAQACRRRQHVESGAPNVTGAPAPTRCGSSGVRTVRTHRPRTPDACPSGHLDRSGRLDTGRLDTGRLDTGHPRDQVDGRPHGGQWRRTERRTAGLASGHPERLRRRRPPAGRPSWAVNLARVAASAALGNP
jgi:hypothetical protein